MQTEGGRGKSSRMYHTLIIGAGQAGLAAGYYLGRAGIPFLILEANERVGDNWRKRWEGLELFTPQRYNALPGLPPPGKQWDLIDRNAAADYLEAYASHHALPITLLCTCELAKEENDTWVVTTDKGVFRAERLIVATGAYKDGYVPAELGASFPESILRLHSSEVRDVAELADERTSLLIVGAGASGQQLARLAARAGAATTLAGPPVANLPRQLLGRDIYWWLYGSGIMTLPTTRFPGKQMTRKQAGILTVGESEQPASVTRITSHVSHYTDRALHFRCQDTAPLPWPAQGRRSVVIWCTGYRNRYPFLPDRLLAGDGRPLQVGGVSTVDASVAFLGLENLRRPNSSLMGGVGRDAKELTAELLSQ